MLNKLTNEEIDEILNATKTIKEAFDGYDNANNWEKDEYETEYCFTEDGKLIFRESNSLLDWIYNLFFKKRKMKILIKQDDSTYKQEVIKAHGGFLEKWLFVRQKIINTILEKKDIKLITGYSQGAAIATIAYFDLLNSKIINDDVKCVVFASPRVFYLPSKSVKRILKGVINFSISLDIVTKLPLAIMGFRHVGIKLKVKPVEYIKTNSIFKNFFYRFIPNPNYHFIGHYRKAISKLY